jgi:hypothetical protein
MLDSRSPAELYKAPRKGRRSSLAMLAAGEAAGRFFLYAVWGSRVFAVGVRLRTDDKEN